MDLDQWIISSEKPPPEEVQKIHYEPDESGFEFTPLTIIAIVALSLLVLVIIIAIAHQQMGSSP